MSIDPKPPATPGSREDLGLEKQDAPEVHEKDADRVEDKGEPFDGNFA